MSLIPRSFYLDDIFDEIGRNTKTFAMKCDVYEKDGNYNVIMDIPGFDKKDIKIECEEGVLVVTAEKNNEVNEEEDRRYIRRERVYGKVSRTFNFADIDEENIKAEFVNGMLKLTIPKTEKVASKKVISID